MNTFKNIAKKILLGYLLLWCIAQLLSPYLTFDLSDSEINDEFAHLPFRLQHHTILVQNRPVHYVSIGNDSLPVALLIHGSPGAWGAFVDVMQDTSLLKHFQLVVVDRIGFGQSDLGNAEASIQKQVQFIAPVLHTYQAKGLPIVVVGHSLGAAVAVRTAIDYPALVNGIVLVAGAVSPSLESDERWFRIPLQSIPIRYLVPSALRAANDELLYLKKSLEEMLPLWRNIKQPVCLIHGTADELVPVANVRFAQQQLTQASSVTVHILPNQSHFIPWEHPEVISKALIAMQQQSHYFRKK